MKKVLILGASGGTGKHLLHEALGRGYDVTVLARDPARLPSGVERARVIKGDALDDAALADAVSGQDVVISALGVGSSLKSRSLIARTVPAIVRAMTNAGVRRLILTSAYGVGETFRDVPILPSILMRVLFRDLYADKALGETEVRRSGLDWTLVYPTTLTNGPKTGEYRAGERLHLRGLPTISRADVAEFLANQIEDETYVRKGVLVSY
jgi:putative NADH-flavin reductase